MVAAGKIKKGKSRAKLVQSRTDVGSDQDADEKSICALQTISADSQAVRINATFDTEDNLVQLEFIKNKYIIPRQLWKIIALIIKFYPYLTKVSLDSGFDQFAIYEIHKMLPFSRITQIDLCNSYVPQANYYILLDNETNLQHLSLSRCRLDDDAFEMITLRLVFPLPASNKLRSLNLSSNSITDKGITSLANALRSNRKLCYLNLSDNRISDNGAQLIFKTLLEFPITSEEIVGVKSRHLAFLKKKDEMIKKLLIDLKISDLDKKKKKASKPTVVPSSAKKKLDKESSLKCMIDTFTNLNLESALYEKAVNIANSEMSEFTDPYSSDNTYLNDGVTYCRGNNELCYLNLSYNNLSNLSMKILLKVLIYQDMIQRTPKGLINVIVEGNPIPVPCEELQSIDDMISIGFNSRRKMSVSKRRYSKILK
ncbi:uncharacterized protein LOC126979358 [Leptidea sinapis]|uniref:uncharacterized protein LOC126979358 n=1 Tax=Leptidea sinapis TaxID=189913 RepID=UPI0021C2C9C2|nr:uncharacterized protein LOC126979358 [Leptidea sinapis]